MAPVQREGLIGPLYWWELVRESRRGRGFLPRFLYAVILLIILAFHLSNNTLTPQTASLLSERTFSSVLWLQYGAVALLTPIFVAGAILEARQQQTLSLLLTTHLTPREIILGKWLGRLMPMLALVLTGFPVLAILQFLGGVRFLDLIVHTSLALLLMLAVGMYAINASTTCRTMGEAFSKTYTIFFVVTLSVCCLASLFSYSAFTTGDYLHLLVILVAGHLICGCIVLRNAIGNISHREHDHDVAAAPVQAENDYQKIVMHRPPAGKASQGRSAGFSLIYHLTRRADVPSVQNWPVLWKGTYFPFSTAHGVMTRSLLALPLILCFIIALQGDASVKKQEQVFIWIRNVVLLVFLILTTLHTVGTLATERTKQTLFHLLATPLHSARILLEFWLGSFFRYRWFALVTALMVMVTWPLQKQSLGILLVIYLCQLGIFSLVAMFLSLIVSQAYQARLLVGVFFFLSVLVMPGMLNSREIIMPTFAEVFLMPFSSWASLSYPYDAPLIGAARPLYLPAIANMDETLLVELLSQVIILVACLAALFLLCNWRLRHWLERT